MPSDLVLIVFLCPKIFILPKVVTEKNKISIDPRRRRRRRQKRTTSFIYIDIIAHCYRRIESSPLFNSQSRYVVPNGR